MGKFLDERGLAALWEKVSERGRVAVTSYVGTGTYGAENPCSLTFDFAPKVIVWLDGINANDSSGTFARCVILADDLTTEYQSGKGFGFELTNYTMCCKKSADGKSVFWYLIGSNKPVDAQNQANKSLQKYSFVAIG